MTDPGKCDMSEAEEIQAKKAKITDFWSSGIKFGEIWFTLSNVSSIHEKEFRKFGELEAYSWNSAVKSLWTCACERNVLQNLCL